MAKKSYFKIWIEPTAMDAVRNSEEVVGIIEEYANDVAQRAKGDYRVETTNGKKRAHTYIKCDSVATYYDNRKNNTLLKAM